MDSSIHFLVMGSVFSVVTSVLWFLWNRCYTSMDSCIFTFVSRKFSLSKHHLRNVTNIAAITRLLAQLELDTHSYLWQHDANVEAEDKTMVGYVRLPTRTWLLWLMAMLGFSHYIWIDDKAREILIVGPTEFVQALLRLSNIAANRMASRHELHNLRATLRLKTIDNPCEWRCMCCERIVGYSLTCACAYVAITTHCSTALSILTLFSFLCLATSCKEHYCSEQVQDESDTDTSEKDPAEECSEDDGNDYAVIAHKHSENISETFLDGNLYSVVVARSSWFEVSFQAQFPLASQPPDIFLSRGSTELHLYAIPMTTNMPQHVASRTQTQEVLYVCVHNPLVDTHLLEMRDLIKKANRTVAIIVLLPCAELLDTELDVASRMRVHGSNETRYMASFSDWHAWLLLFSTGVFSHLALALPYRSEESLQSSELWTIASRTVRTCMLTSFS